MAAEAVDYDNSVAGYIAVVGAGNVVAAEGCIVGIHCDTEVGKAVVAELKIGKTTREGDQARGRDVQILAVG